MKAMPVLTTWGLNELEKQIRPFCLHHDTRGWPHKPGNLVTDTPQFEKMSMNWVLVTDEETEWRLKTMTFRWKLGKLEKAGRCEGGTWRSMLNTGLHVEWKTILAKCEKACPDISVLVEKWFLNHSDYLVLNQRSQRSEVSINPVPVSPLAA